MWNPEDNGEWFRQRGSFLQPVAPPTTEICDSPVCCITVNQEWLPYLAGAAMQLAQPSTWKTATEADRQTAIARATDLIAEIGLAMPCISPPVSAAGVTSDQQACNIAGYLANMVIKASMQQAVDQYNSDSTILGYGAAILAVIPGAGLVVYGVLQAIRVFWLGIADGGVTDWQDAAVDATLWSKITCAIYNAISADGQVTDANYPAVLTAISAVSYTHSDVITGIHDYMAALGASGAEQLQQVGALAVYDCTSCGTGVSTGPAALPTRSAAGTIAITITAGSATAGSLVTFDEAFSTVPVITLGVDSADLIASVASVAAGSFLATITAAVNVLVDTTANVTWSATLAGTL